MSPVLIGILAYLVAQIGIGVWYSRRIRTMDDYLLGGRRLGVPLVAGSVFATWFAAETCIGAAGETYRDGLVAATTDPLGYGVAVLLIGILFAAPLRHRGYVTVLDLFRERYGAGVERFAALLAIPSSLLWAAAQIRAFGQILSTFSEIDIGLAITVAAFIVVTYTMIGGFMADTVSDMVQGSVLVAGLVVLAVAIVRAGDAAALADIPPDRWALLPAGEPWLAHVERWAVPVIGTLAVQELIARALAARSPEIARRGTIAGGLLYISVGMIPILAGLVGWRLMPGLDDPDQVLILQATAYLPTALEILFVGALVSAILSTVDSTLLVAGSFAAHNFVLSIRPGIDSRGRLLLNRGAVVGFGVVAYAMAISGESVYNLVMQSTTFGTAGIVVAFVLAFRRGWGGAWAAAAALVTGSVAYHLGSRGDAVAYPYLTALALSLAAFAAGGSGSV